MFRPAFASFQRVCGQQGVKLNPRIVDAGVRAKSSLEYPIEPNGLYSAVAEAGNILRRNPGIRLADAKIVAPESGRHRLNRSLAGRTLLAMVNASIEPVSGASWDTTFRCVGTHAISTCLGAERGFGMVITQMYTPYKPLPGESTLVGYQLITGENDRPIAVRKGTGEPSTLSFVDMTINGIPYPAGSIFRAEIMDDLYTDPDEGPGYGTNVPWNACGRIGVERVSHIAFRRLSAFAGSPASRRRDFAAFWKGEWYARWTRDLQSVTMDDIKDIAENAAQAAIAREK